MVSRASRSQVARKGNIYREQVLLAYLGQRSGGEMKPVAIVGIVLIVLGIAGLVLGRFTYTTEEKVLDVGPLEATAEKEHSVAIPDIAGIAAILAGGFLVFVGRRRA
jgi:hypothetical protein